MLKVFLTPQAGLSRAMDRVAKNLIVYMGHGIQPVNLQEDADLELLHVIGYPETVAAIDRITSAGKKYGVIQYCLRSTQEPNTEKWLDIWKGAEIVWSYYDLDQACKEDQQFVGARALSRFYISPLGADAKVFQPVPSKRPYAILTSGYIPETEGVLEAELATQECGMKMVHLGPVDDRYGSHVRTVLNISDPQLAEQYSLCRYVAGLRRVEGFELPAAEGLLCGARPIMFDRPHYRRWFENLADFIPEGTGPEVVEYLIEKFREPESNVTKDQLQEAVKRFNWETIIGGFWAKLKNPAPQVFVPEKGRVRPSSKSKKTLLVVADAAVATGFAKATHKYLDVVHHHYDTHVVGINYYGEPHDYPYKIWPPKSITGGDAFGVQRMAKLISKLRPSLVLVQNDVWNIPSYLRHCGNVPMVAALAVDGKNCRGAGLNGLRHAIFWTKFGQAEAREGGYSGQSTVIPLGVDLDLYKPLDREACRELLPFDRSDRDRIRGAFIIGNVNRNHPRKRLDLQISMFAEWIHTRQINDAFLFIHSAPTGDDAVDIGQLAQFFGIQNRILLFEPEVGGGIPEEKLPLLYNSFDLLCNTSQGEGWGLPAMEAMACGVPTLGGAWAAYPEWAESAMKLILCSEIACTPNRINAVGGIIDRAATLAAWDDFYKTPELRQFHRQEGLKLVARPEFRWENIGERYLDVLDTALAYRTPMATEDIAQMSPAFSL